MKRLIAIGIPNFRPMRTLEPAERPVGCVLFVSENVKRQHPCIHPHHDGAGDAGSYRSKPRHAEIAIHEDVIAHDVAGECDQTGVHDRPRHGNSFAVRPQGLKETKARRTPRNRFEKSTGHRNEFRRNADDGEQPRGIAQSEKCTDADDQGQPQALSDGMSDRVTPAGAEGMRNSGRNRKQDADERKRHRPEHVGADRDGCQVLRAQSSSHHRIHKTHRDMRELRRDQGSAQVESCGGLGSIPEERHASVKTNSRTTRPSIRCS
jgi:hypothetical protein